MASIERPRRTRGEVAREYGHPWPWRVPELVEEYAVERIVELSDLAQQWGITRKWLDEWIRRHGFRVKDGQAVR